MPAEFNYDFWLGQAPQAEYFTERCHQTFRWWFDYAGGPVTDWGAHHNDIARWGIGLDGPVGIEARVITPPLPDGYTTPSEFEATLDWANGVKQIVKTTLADSPFGAILDEKGQRNGVKFIGADGWIWVNRDGISASDPELLHTPLPDNAVKLEVSRNHMRKFLRLREVAQRPGGQRRDRPPLRVHRPPHHHRLAHRLEIAVESGRGTIHRRGRGGGDQTSRPRNARALRLQICRLMPPEARDWGCCWSNSCLSMNRPWFKAGEQVRKEQGAFHEPERRSPTRLVSKYVS